MFESALTIGSGVIFVMTVLTLQFFLQITKTLTMHRPRVDLAFINHAHTYAPRVGVVWGRDYLAALCPDHINSAYQDVQGVFSAHLCGQEDLQEQPSSAGSQTIELFVAG